MSKEVIINVNSDNCIEHSKSQTKLLVAIAKILGVKVKVSE